MLAHFKYDLNDEDDAMDVEIFMKSRAMHVTIMELLQLMRNKAKYPPESYTEEQCEMLDNIHQEMHDLVDDNLNNFFNY